MNVSETASTYGKTGSAALVAAGIAWAIAVAMGDVGTTADGLTRGIGYLGLVLLVIGTVALVLMLFDLYTHEA